MKKKLLSAEAMHVLILQENFHGYFFFPKTDVKLSDIFTQKENM